MYEKYVGDLVSILKNNKNRIINEAVQIMGDGIEDYISKNVNEFAYIKTLLNRHSPRHIEEVYYPLSIKFEETVICIDEVRKLFKNTKYITIRGDAGSGKSTILKYIFVNALKSGYYLPLFVKLRDINEDEGFEDVVLQQLIANKMCQDKSIAKRMLNRGSYLLLLDGLDELSISSGNRMKKEINQFVEKFYLNHYILTTRPYSNVEMLSVFMDYEIQEFRDNDICSFIKLSVEDNVADQIVHSVTQEVNEHYISFLRNPLLLSLYILTYNNHNNLPRSRALYYRRVIDVLFSEHDSLSKAGYSREYETKLIQEDLEHILQIFSFITHFNEHYKFNFTQLNEYFANIRKSTDYKFVNKDLVYDLTNSTSIWSNDDGELSYVHKSIQEYFAAVYLSKLVEEKQEVIFERLRNLFITDKYFSQRNFMVLYSEIDKCNFHKNVLKPVYHDYLSRLKQENDLDKVEALYCGVFSGIYINDTIKRNMSYEYGDFKLNLLEDELDLHDVTNAIMSFVWSLDSDTRDMLFDDYEYSDGDLEYLKRNNKKLNFNSMFQMLPNEILESDMIKVTKTVIVIIEEGLDGIKKLEDQQKNQLALLDFVKA